jgi:hypothetical protein
MRIMALGLTMRQGQHAWLWTPGRKNPELCTVASSDGDYYEVRMHTGTDTRYVYRDQLTFTPVRMD